MITPRSGNESVVISYGIVSANIITILVNANNN